MLHFHLPRQVTAKTGFACTFQVEVSAEARRRYLRKHDILPSSAQRDTEEVVDCRSIPEADSSVILLVWGSADHCVPICLGTDTNGASDHKRARENFLHRKFHPSSEAFCLKPSRGVVFFFLTHPNIRKVFP